ncbi:MAG: chemotaxis response regulator protein-glutamate methylesterase [Acidobacteria bacterium RIFCSPLOWO2_02_FULL_65_29]|nr:MAG: chemotaxis response regulator protein-glutamate methylesterase [Acidobacteria bacterium RIFCSPLOWO2_02_FULL_65_29]
MANIRVLVVEDSTTVRRHLCQVLAADRGFDIVGEAADGKQAIGLCCALRPDVVTMDMMMPVMSGLGATEYIMAHCPTPILVVSSSTNRGELFKTYEALAAGALDVLEKPSGREAGDGWERKFIATLRLISRIRVITHPRARLRTLGRAEVEPMVQTSPPDRRRCRVVAIGASTGGPSAVVEVLRALPSSFPLPLLLVLHIAEPFGAAFADWLDGQTAHRVSYARDGELVSARAGQVMMAPSESHLVVRGGRAHLTLDAARHSCRPSVDVLFESIAREYGGASAACLLTGMGCDGASGLLAVRRAGGFTIAQDEATSVVYGMPREAALLGAAGSVLPLDEIGPTLSALARRLPESRGV